MPNFTRTETDVLGSFASPAPIAAAGVATTAPLDLTGTNASDGVLTVTLIIGSTPPATAPTIAFNESLDGTNYETVVTLACPNVASSRFACPYSPSHPAVKKVTATITNGATTGITAYAQASVRAIV